MATSREESRERFLKQLEKCATLQNPMITLPLAPSAPWKFIVPGPSIAPEDMGNGAGLVPCETENVLDICPTHDNSIPLLTEGDWA